jgi:hypothetical protein
MNHSGLGRIVMALAGWFRNVLSDEVLLVQVVLGQVLKAGSDSQRVVINLFEKVHYCR